MQEVASAVFMKGSRILMEKRREDEDNYAEIWSFPAGHIKGGESPAETLAREMKEELDVETGNSVFIASLSDRDPTSGDEYVHYFYLVREWSGDIEKTNEQKKLEWFDIGDAPAELDIHKKVIKKLKEMM